jgi:hypothetical protein
LEFYGGEFLSFVIFNPVRRKKERVKDELIFREHVYSPELDSMGMILKLEERCGIEFGMLTSSH